MNDIENHKNVILGDVECEGDWHESSWCNLGPCAEHFNLVSSETSGKVQKFDKTLESNF